IRCVEIACEYPAAVGIEGRRAMSVACRARTPAKMSARAAIATAARAIVLGPRARAIGPEHHARHPIVRAADVHAAGHEIDRAILVEIAKRERDEMRRRPGDRMHGELLFAVVLPPDQALRSW